MLKDFDDTADPETEQARRKLDESLKRLRELRKLPVYPKEHVQVEPVRIDQHKRQHSDYSVD